MVENEQLTIMFTDISGFTNKTSRKSRAELHQFLEIHEGLIVPIFEEFGGRIIKTIGDAFLAVFKSPTNAVLCGMEIQRALLIHNENSREEDKLEVRVAINSGEVSVRDNDVFGEPVNIAARVEGIAGPNEIYFTEAVYLAMNKNEIPTAEVGHRRLKGISQEIKVYKVLSEDDKKVSKEAEDSEETKKFKVEQDLEDQKRWEIKARDFLAREKQKVVKIEEVAVSSEGVVFYQIKILLAMVLVTFLIFVVFNYLEKNGGVRSLQTEFNQLKYFLNKPI